MRSIVGWTALGCLSLLVLVAPTDALAQKDNTGTNPANFTYDARFYFEMAELDDPTGSLITNTFELRWPLGRDLGNVKGAEEGGLYDQLGKKFGMRIRARYQSLSLDTPGAVPFGTSEVSGIGDIDARVLYMAYASKRIIVVPGLEAIFDTATNPALGNETNVLAPVLFAVFPGILGGTSPGILGGTSLFAPGYQYLFDVSGNDAKVSRSQIDLYFVWLLGKGKYWLIVDPQIVIDHENKKEPALIEVEWGYMISPSAGASTYIRPGAGIGPDKPYVWNLEAGLKFVWR
jgi:hypothetical protein